MERMVTGKRLIGSGTLNQLVEVNYSDNLKWEMVEKINKNPYGADIVDIIAILDATPTPQIILLSHHYVTIGFNCLELPHGIFSGGSESLERVGRCEIFNQTGYYGNEVEGFNELLYVDPGVCDFNMKYVKIKIDPQDSRNINPKASHTPNSKMHLLPFDSNLYNALLDLCRENNFVLDARLASIALGMKLLK